MAAEERRLGDWLTVAVFVAAHAHKDAHAVCGPGLTSRLLYGLL